jgi:hypothetical protein
MNRLPFDIGVLGILILHERPLLVCLGDGWSGSWSPITLTRARENTTLLAVCTGGAERILRHYFWVITGVDGGEVGWDLGAGACTVTQTVGV